MTTEPGNPPTVLFVAGAGRSGTSTVAGALSRLGFAVPQPEVPPDESNPRGFYEPQWVVDFHERVLEDIGIRVNDARPEAVDRAAVASARSDLFDELTEWLAPYAADRIVVKDPRSFWLHELWRRAIVKTGMEAVFLTMLRHPAEVAKSRDTHYLACRDAELRRARETTNVASWCHGILVTERATRDDRRTFVPYADLMSDWRAALRRVDEQLGLGVMTDVEETHHANDDFIDTALYRSKVTWDDLSVPAEVTALADEVWETVNLLVSDPGDAAAMARMDELHARYDRLYALARDLMLDQTFVDRAAHRRTQAAARERFRARIERLEERLAQARARAGRLEERVALLQKQNDGLARELDRIRGSLPYRIARRARRALPR
ncbi:sulfotransferase family protein [Nocardioides sp. DS6]|uniref:Sulfotransferase family protein n=1 Tax=Nocardioides eburneus TaxID=3231482 RepID=A0ABV3SWP0_9ACTN